MPYFIDQLIHQLISRIRSSLDLQTVLNTTVQEVRDVLSVERTVLYRFYENWDGAVVSEACSPGVASILGTITDECFGASYAWQYRNGRIRAIDDIQQAGLAPCHVEMLLGIGVRANVIVPILQGEQLWGLLIAHRAQAHTWAQEEIDLLRCIAEQLSIAIQQAHLLAQVRRQAAREALVYDIARQVRATLDLDKILSTATVRLREALQTDRVVVYRLSGDGGGGFNCNESVDPRYPAMLLQHYGPDCIPSDYLQPYTDGQTRMQFDISEARLTTCHREMLVKAAIQAYMIVPVISSGRLWGLLAVHQCDGPRRWQEEEVQLVQTIAGQVATAVEHAALLAEALAQKALLACRNRELEQARRTAEAALRVKSEFLAVVSHELRTPFNGILGTLELLQLDGLEDREERQQLVELALQSTQELLRIVNDLLDVSRIEHTGADIEVYCQPLDVGWLLRSVITRLEVQARHKGLRLVLEIEDPLIVEADPDRLRQVFFNLIGNAIKFTEHGYVHVQAKAIDGILCASIRDTGIGISRDQQARLFQPFVQVDSSSTRRHNGIGLGLMISKRLIERMSGSIQLDSPGLGCGTQVCIHMPLYCQQNSRPQLAL